MSKTFLIILIISWLSGWVVWYYLKHSITPISTQLDLKSGSTHINWVIWTTSYCDTTNWICQNRSSSSSSSSSWWTISWGWGK